jgi:hypothetical protein
MRRYIGFAALIAAMALGMALWSRSAVEVTSANAVRSSSGLVPYEFMTNSKNLPIEHIENPM